MSGTKLRNEKMRVLVLLSAYNGEKFILEQLNSLKAQEGVQMHCLIRDDGSSDRTSELLEEYCRKNPGFEWIKGQNCGVIKSFNELLKNDLCMQYDWIAFCDQDDVWLSAKLKRAVHVLMKSNLLENKPLVYCSNLELVDASLAHIGYMRSASVKVTKYTAVVQNCATGCTMVFNQAARLEYLKGIDSAMEMHDYWMFLIGVYLGNLIYDSRALIQYRQHGANVIGAKKQTIKGAVQNLSKTGNHEKMLLDFMDIYSESISDDDKAVMKLVTRANHDWKCRLHLMLDPRFHGYSFKRTLGFKIRAAIGRVY